MLETKLSEPYQFEAALEEEPDVEVELFVFSEEYTEGDVEVQSSIDSSYTSHSGAIGISNNEASTAMKHKPLNLTSRFP